MNKLCLLLTLALLLGCLAGCQMSQSPEQTNPTQPQKTYIENPDGTLAQWLKDEIESLRWGWTWFEDGGYDNMIYGYRYLGTYNGYVVLFAPGTADMVYWITIGNYTFDYHCGFDLYGYKDGIFHELKDLYNQGLVDDTDIQSAWEAKEGYDQLVIEYKESRDNQK